MSKKNKISNKDGFTLIELLIVCAIIGIMVAIVLAYLAGAKAKGRDGARIADMKQLEQTLEVYFSSCGAYPTANGNGTLPASMIACGSSQIINSLPKDPINTSPYIYKYYTGDVGGSVGLKYHLCATLELSTTGIGKSGVSSGASGISQDGCDGSQPTVYDKYGPL